MKLIMKIFSSLALVLFLMPFLTLAQGTNDIEMADAFRAEGKIYVVVAIIGVILIGLLIYLIMLDRKISRLEKRKQG